MPQILVNDIIEQTVQVMNLPIKEDGRELIFEYSQKKPIVMTGDSDRLHQLFSNLMNNSLKYTNSPGKLTVKLEKAQKKAITM